MKAELLFKALSSETRIRIVKRLLKGDASVSDLVSHIKRSQPDISIALNKLHMLDIVSQRRSGRFIIYSLTDKKKMRRLFSLIEDG